MQNVLIAESDPSLALLWQTAFEKAGFRVTVVHDGNAAMTYLSEFNLPDVLLVEQMVSGVHGSDILGWLPQNTLKPIYTILITAAPASVPLEAKTLADAFLEKPIGFGQLVSLARRLAIGPRLAS